MATRISADDAALLIWEELDRAGLRGRTLPELRLHCELTTSQVRNGIAWLKEVLQVPNRQPVGKNWMEGECRYVLNQDWTDQEISLLREFRDLLTRATRIEPTAEASSLKWGNRGIRRLVWRSIRRVKEDLADLLGGID